MLEKIDRVGKGMKKKEKEKAAWKRALRFLSIFFSGWSKKGNDLDLPSCLVLTVGQLLY